MGEIHRKNLDKKRTARNANTSGTHVSESTSEGDSENSSLLNVLDSTNRILYGTTESDSKVYIGSFEAKTLSKNYVSS